MAKAKRVVIIADKHCGHRAGLTPPAWWYPENEDNAEWQKFAKVQREMWGWYDRTMAKLQPIDLLIVNGDAIEGKGDRSGATELIDADRSKQVDMAIKCINVAKAKKIVMIYGTPYHTGIKEDWEGDIARALQAAHIGWHEWPSVNGLVFDCKHFIGGSTIEHGRHTAIARSNLWNRAWAERGDQPRADVLIRSHVHYFIVDQTPTTLMMITPALQGYATKYGAGRCEGTVDIGLISFDVTSKEKYSWTKHLLKPKSLVAQTLNM